MRDFVAHFFHIPVNGFGSSLGELDGNWDMIGDMHELARRYAIKLGGEVVLTMHEGSTYCDTCGGFYETVSYVNADGRIYVLRDEDRIPFDLFSDTFGPTIYDLQNGRLRQRGLSQVTTERKYAESDYRHSRRKGSNYVSFVKRRERRIVRRHARELVSEQMEAA